MLDAYRTHRLRLRASVLLNTQDQDARRPLQVSEILPVPAEKQDILPFQRVHASSILLCV